MARFYSQSLERYKTQVFSATRSEKNLRRAHVCVGKVWVILLMVKCSGEFTYSLTLKHTNCSGYRL